MYKEECEALISIALNFGVDSLKKYKEFYPYGVVILSDDTVEFTAAYDGDEHPESQNVINDLTKIHQQLAKEGKIKASAIAWDGRVTDEEGNKVDAIMVNLEHKEGYAIMAYLPYKFGFLKSVKFGEMQYSKGNKEIFK